jgi:hypothetical protein
MIGVHRVFGKIWEMRGDVPSSPASVSSCSVMEGRSDISFFKASLERNRGSVHGLLNARSENG